MLERLSFYLKNAIEKVNGETLFLISLIFMTIGLAFSVTISIFNRNYTKKGRIWFCLLVGALSLFQVAFTIISKLQLGYVLMTLSVGLLYAIPVFFISRKKRTVKEEERELVRFLDSQISRGQSQGLEDENAVDRVSITPQVLPLEKKNNAQPKSVEVLKTQQTSSLNESLDDLPDFSHVKNVVERLNYFPLTPSDKRQVKDLENTIVRAENGESTPDLKNRINDGLGALLKIMSKYGV